MVRATSASSVESSRPFFDCGLRILARHLDPSTPADFGFWNFDFGLRFADRTTSGGAWASDPWGTRYDEDSLRRIRAIREWQLVRP